MPNSRTPLMLGLLLAAAAVALPLRAEEGAAATAEVEALFKQLSADDSKTRDAARKSLVDLGDEAVPRIKALAATSQDPETRASVEAILDAIEARSVNGPSLITLDVKDMPAEQVIREIAKQAHAELPVWPDWVFKQGPLKDRKVTLNVKRQPFWKVMKDLLPDLGLTVMSHGGGDSMKISQGQSEMMKGPAHLDGPFMVVATTAHESNTITLANPAQRSSSVSVGLQAFIEPKLKVMGRGHTAVIEDLTDETGTSLVAGGQPLHGHDPSRIETHFRESTFQFHVSVPAGRAKKVGRLKGFVRVLLQAKSDRIEVPDLSKAKGSIYTKAGWRLEVKDLADNKNGEYTLRLEVTRDVPIRPQPGQLPQNDWKDRFQGDAIHVFDAEGRRLERGGYSISGQNHIYTCEMRFRRAGTPAGPPATLKWEFPTEAQEVRVPFEFKDLPLP